MEKFLETPNLPGLKHDLENLDRPITSKEIESTIKTFQQRRAQDQMASLEISTKQLKN